MTDKQTDALKLALEALKELRMLGMNMQWHDSWLAKSETAITAIREALEQPAQQEPVAWGMPSAGGGFVVDCITPEEHDRVEGGYTIPLYTSPPAQQQEPVAYASDVEFDDETEIIPAEQKGKLGTAGLRIPLYIDPPASKPWVGLTDEEMRDLEKQFNAERVRTSDEEYLIIYPGDYWAWQRAIEAKLREKNA